MLEPLTVGCLWGLPLCYSNSLRAGVWAVILVLGGMAVGRCYGLIVDGSANGFMYLYLALEILAVAVSFVVLALRPSFHQE